DGQRAWAAGWPAGMAGPGVGWRGSDGAALAGGIAGGAGGPACLAGEPAPDLWAGGAGGGGVAGGVAGVPAVRANGDAGRHFPRARLADHFLPDPGAGNRPGAGAVAWGWVGSRASGESARR